RQMLAAYGEGGAVLRGIANDLRQEVVAALSASDEAFDLSLDATKPQLDRSVALAAQIEEGLDGPEIASGIRHWAGRLGIHAKKLEDGSNEFRWTNGSLNISSNRLRIGAGTDSESRLVCGTFMRSTALAREDLQYFAPGHDLIDAMIFEAEHGRHSRVSAFMLEGFPKHRGTILLQVLGRSVLDQRLWEGHDIGAGLAARARSLLWPEVIAEIMLLWDNGGAHHKVVTHTGLRSLLDHPQRDLKLKPIEPSTISGLSYLPQIWSAIDQAVPAALESIQKRRTDTAFERAELLETSLRAEVGYLRWQAENAGDEETTAKHRAAIAARDTLVQSLRAPRVDLLGLALVALV
ncbi:hypothetical protein, partial [Mesorhizobium sp. M4B.F.Ca.ET.089.01.1.1]|uniref:hypothetical protein n=1 Tax=Mesorhizobium sp. M4B.F.Ca.ET.089.01.1.1 TaxID=2496662 RepID=UPI0016725346